MIERAIENWLINTNERDYQTAYCQILIHSGHKILYVSSHRPMEQGKDIITIDWNEDYHVYQLKTGNIDLKKWREIVGEVKELIELPIIHPSVDKSKIPKAHLVTNGDVTDEVRIQIDQINEDNIRKKRNYAYLEIVNAKTLLREFINAQGEFIPQKLEDFDLFLEFFLTKGTDFLDKEKFFNFLNSTIFKDISPPKSRSLNAISSSVIIVSYLLNPYQIKKNYFALFEAWTCLCGAILRYANKSGLIRAEMIDSYNLVFAEIIRNLILLREEVLGRKDFLEGEWLGDGDLIYRARTTIVLGVLGALEIHLHESDETYIPSSGISDFIKSNLSLLWFWGESAFPYFFYIIKILGFNREIEIARGLLCDLTLILIQRNSLMSHACLPNPYFSVNDILQGILKLTRDEIDFDQFSGSSYTLRTMILMLVRRGNRKFLEKSWRNISHIQFKEFQPACIEDTFTWRLDIGKNCAEFPKATQSWSDLGKEANDLSCLPEMYKVNKALLRFFIITCPHRSNLQIIGLLD
jgi:hypothetical protein